MFGPIGWVAMDDPLQWVPASNDDDAAASNGRFARLCIARSVKKGIKKSREADCTAHPTAKKMSVRDIDVSCQRDASLSRQSQYL